MTKAMCRAPSPGPGTRSSATRVVRDILSKNRFEKLMTPPGIGNDTTVVIYGDSNNWFAAWAFWQMKMYGHKEVRLMNGGRKKWMSEGRRIDTQRPGHSCAQLSIRPAGRIMPCARFSPGAGRRRKRAAR